MACTRASLAWGGPIVTNDDLGVALGFQARSEGQSQNVVGIHLVRDAFSDDEARLVVELEHRDDGDLLYADCDFHGLVLDARSKGCRSVPGLSFVGDPLFDALLEAVGRLGLDGRPQEVDGGSHRVDECPAWSAAFEVRAYTGALTFADVRVYVVRGRGSNRIAVGLAPAEYAKQP